MYERVIKVISWKGNTSMRTVFEWVENILSKKVIPQDIKKCAKIKKSKFFGIFFWNFVSFWKASNFSFSQTLLVRPLAIKGYKKVLSNSVSWQCLLYLIVTKDFTKRVWRNKVHLFLIDRQPKITKKDVQALLYNQKCCLYSLLHQKE